MKKYLDLIKTKIQQNRDITLDEDGGGVLLIEMGDAVDWFYELKIDDIYFDETRDEFMSRPNPPYPSVVVDLKDVVEAELKSLVTQLNQELNYGDVEMDKIDKDFVISLYFDSLAELQRSIGFFTASVKILADGAEVDPLIFRDATVDFVFDVKQEPGARPTFLVAESSVELSLPAIPYALAEKIPDEFSLKVSSPVEDVFGRSAGLEFDFDIKIKDRQKNEDGTVTFGFDADFKKFKEV